jgi:hypothetical protein
MADEAEQPRRMIRFDFEPGASPKEIAEAIQRAREKLMAQYAAEKAKKAE